MGGGGTKICVWAGGGWGELKWADSGVDTRLPCLADTRLNVGWGYIPHDNIHEINTWRVPFNHSVLMVYIAVLC